VVRARSTSAAVLIATSCRGTPAGWSRAVDDVADGERVFAALGHKGKVQQAFQPTFWAKGFGMLVDQFGTPWIVNAGQLIGN